MKKSNNRKTLSYFHWISAISLSLRLMLMLRLYRPVYFSKVDFSTHYIIIFPPDLGMKKNNAPASVKRERVAENMS